MSKNIVRCPWGESHPLYVVYHDKEWGVPQHDDHKLFEMLILEGAQAGLSWITILKKRNAYRLRSAVAIRARSLGTTHVRSSDCWLTIGSSETD